MHAKKVGNTSEFLLAFVDESDKQLFTKKLLNWANKKRNNFNIYNIVFSLKKPQRKSRGGIIILQLCNKNVDDMIQSSGDMEHDGLKLAILAWGYLEQI